MVGRTEGDVTLADLMGYLDDVERAKAVGYAKIFDCTVGQASLMPMEREPWRKSRSTPLSVPLFIRPLFQAEFC